MLLREDRRGPSLVVGVGIAVQQNDADRADAGLADRARRVAHLRLVQRLELGSVRLDAPADLEDMRRRHRPFRLDPGEQARAPRHVLAADLEHVSKALGGDERSRRALAFEDQVGGDRRAVQHARDIRPREPASAQDRRETLSEGLRGVGGSRGYFCVRDAARARVEKRDVGEGSPGVDADHDGGRAIRCCHQSSTSW